jgi:parvulin-like peptidyl-prolyl isomerase
MISSWRALGSAALSGTATLFSLIGSADARVVEKIAAVVGDDLILDSEVREAAEPAMVEISSITDQAQRAVRAQALTREVLERLIDDQLILQQATELKLSVTSEEIDRSIEQVKKEQNLNDNQLREALRAQGMSMTAYRQSMRRQILHYHVLRMAVGGKITVTDGDVQSYYDRNLRSGANVQVRASHIFIVIPEGADNAVVLEKQQAATKLLDRAKAGEDFAKLAKEFSEDANTRNSGGDLDWFGRGILPKPIEELVFSMRVGEVQGPVRAERGFHVIKLVDRNTKQAKPLSEVKEQLRAQLHQKEMERQTRNYLGELRKKTLVDIRM